eukprot:scaffold10082_cov115-Isochrysis_galbana.AAC.9
MPLPAPFRVAAEECAGLPLRAEGEARAEWGDIRAAVLPTLRGSGSTRADWEPSIEVVERGGAFCIAPVSTRRGDWDGRARGAATACPRGDCDRGIREGRSRPDDSCALATLAASRIGLGAARSMPPLVTPSSPNFLRTSGVS